MSTSNLCPVCRGAGSIVTFSRGLEYWPCVCGGSGVRLQHGPARVTIHGRPAKRRKGAAPSADVVRFPVPDTLRAGNNAARRAGEAAGLTVNPRIADAGLA